MITFITKDGNEYTCTFMKVPKLNTGYIWNLVSPNGSDNVYLEQMANWAGANPNDVMYSNKLFGYDETDFLAKQYK